MALDNENGDSLPGPDDYCFGQNLSESGELITEALLCFRPPVDPRLTLYPIGKQNINFCDQGEKLSR